MVTIPLGQKIACNSGKEASYPFIEANVPAEEQAPATPSKESKVASFDWLAMLHRTFLSIYLVKDDPLVGAGKFDYAFKVGKQLLCHGS